MPKVCVFTLGCKVNQYDSDAMLAIFEHGGFEVAEGLEPAEVYVINSCAVTQEAERKSRQTVSRIRKISPDAQIYVCGCASQNNFSQFAKDGVQYISGTDKKLELARNIVAKYADGKDAFSKIVAPDAFGISETFEDNDGIVNLRTRHFIKIQDGCNNFCSYCIVPYLRGRSRSRAVESIMRELDSVKDSAKEVVITGINLSAYGRDIGTGLAELLKSLKDRPFRIRLGSLEVGVVDREFLDATKTLANFCPHFHLSLQSGDDGVLTAMNRHYTSAQYSEAVRLIREYYPHAAITTDIIVGFPAESEREFVNSMEFARKIGFSDIHVFPYSSRRGTVAGRMQVLPPDVVDDRQKRMSALKHELIANYLNKQIGMSQQVLFETCENGVWCGHSSNYVKVYSKNGARNALRVITPSCKYLDGVADQELQ